MANFLLCVQCQPGTSLVTSRHHRYRGTRCRKRCASWHRHLLGVRKTMNILEWNRSSPIPDASRTKVAHVLVQLLRLKHEGVTEAVLCGLCALPHDIWMESTHCHIYMGAVVLPHLELQLIHPWAPKPLQSQLAACALFRMGTKHLQCSICTLLLPSKFISVKASHAQAAIRSSQEPFSLFRETRHHPAWKRRT